MTWAESTVDVQLVYLYTKCKMSTCDAYRYRTWHCMGGHMCLYILILIHGLTVTLVAVPQLWIGSIFNSCIGIKGWGGEGACLSPLFIIYTNIYAMYRLAQAQVLYIWCSSLSMLVYETNRRLLSWKLTMLI